MKDIIYISAGHSDADPGAVNKKMSLREADLTRGSRNLVVDVLQMHGATVRMDGTDATNLDRDTAIMRARECTGLKLDIHFNAATGTATGTEAFSDKAEKEIAQELAQAVSEVLGIPLRGEKGWKGRTESQHGARGLAWLDRLQRSVLLEVCFMDNDAEIKKYLARMDDVAEAIANVLLKHN
jgi:N-acetylmuramoyl-L-alanine amidase